MILYGGGGQKDGGGSSGPGVGGAGGGGGGGAAGVVLKKGPWTAAEDEILAAYVREHGEGNWNVVQKNTGLVRCGKSCRLRWANHLRPNLKKGAFSPEEERLIIQLHAQLGNKWARMAAQLPGRTDNEIKNYWNTRLKRFQRQGLPLYPPDIIPTYQVQHQHHHHHHHHHQLQQQQQQIYLQSSSQPTTPCSPLLSPTPTATTVMVGAASSSSFTFQTTTQLCPHSPTPCPTPTTPQPPSPLSPTPPPLSPPLPSPQQHPTLPLFAVPKSPTTTTTTRGIVTNDDAFSFPRHPPLLKQPSLRFKRFNNDNGTNSNNNHANIVPTLSTNTSTCSNGVLTHFSPLTKSSYTSFLTLPYSSPATPTDATSFNTNQATYLVSSSSSSHLPSFSLNPSSFAPASSPNLLQTQFNSSNYSVYSVKPELPSSQNSHPIGMGLFDTTNLTNNETQHQDQTNLGLRRSSSGLLEDVLEEAEVLAGSRGPKRRQVLGLFEENSLVVGFGHCGSSSSISSPSGLKPKEEETLQMNAMQEDLAKLLDVIPSTMRALDWASDSGEISNGQSSVVTDDNLVLDVQQLASLFPLDAATDEHNNNPTTSCSWDNLPGIC